MAQQQLSSQDVVIIGLGPVGATLANLLGLCGITTLVLEREPSAYHLPRAVHFDDEVMRIFQTIGLSDQIAKDVILSPGMRFLDASGRLIMDWSRPAEVSSQGWHPSYRFHQPDLERVLRCGLARWPTVTVRNRSDVYALTVDENGVSVRFEDLSNGQLLQCRAKYVVGCDGSRSLVRRFIGTSLQDLGFHERWLVVDALLQRPRPDLGDHSIQYCDPARPATYVRGTGERRRWEIRLHPDEDAQLMSTSAHVWNLLSRWITPDDAVLERAAVYTFHSVIAEGWRDGPLLLAGDSAHQTPPFLGQGMCAGVRDAGNLAWKLAHIIQAKTADTSTADTLLNSYESERAPHVRAFIELAVRLGGVINTKATEAGLLPGRNTADQPVRMESIKPQLGPGLFAGRHDLTGQLAPQPELIDGRRLDMRVGYRFALLAAPVFIAELPVLLRNRIAQCDLVLVDDNVPALQEWLRSHNAKAVLVRPDRYVLGSARDQADLEALLASVPGRAARSETVAAK